MRRLDASFCKRLTGPAMAAALAGAGRLQEVVLSVCLGVDAVTVLALSMMQDLRSLDLSYTGVEVRELCRRMAAWLEMPTDTLMECVDLSEWSTWFRLPGPPALHSAQDGPAACALLLYFRLPRG